MYEIPKVEFIRHHKQLLKCGFIWFHNSFSRKHYIEYLVVLVNNKLLDPADIMSSEDLGHVLRRGYVQQPPKPNRMNANQYHELLLRVSRPLCNMSLSIGDNVSLVESWKQFCHAADCFQQTSECLENNMMGHHLECLTSSLGNQKLKLEIWEIKLLKAMLLFI